jgi:hypothetical protein
MGGGFGFVGINRPAIEAIAASAEEESAPPLVWFDDGVRKLAVFYERLEDGLWHGEDSAFFRYRIPDGVSVEALLVGSCSHAGVPLNLAAI